ncbi:TIGR04104 family putative zinc finger protein [Geomicrobium sp. JCM 19038]|uniref:TIGR04104 family putative zinc finger protein n=1 Tax=Geomicrobium sp. JCM 19038 TaxID=1460635 RepID=UPI00187CF8BF|nr:TIGR04104 family putative zinc finger protein [Geomicrobium sp. JCM 19038]
MPTCWKCEAAMSWRQCIGLYHRIDCSVCGTRNYISSKAQWNIGTPYFIILILQTVLHPWLDISFISSLIFIVLYAVLIHLFIQPFLLEYKEDKQYLIDGFN